jgi:uncharacterized protein
MIAQEGYGMSIIFPMVPGVEINLYLLVFLSFAIGIISGFTGVGGGFLMTPALIILGFPAQIAVGTSLIWVMANSIVGSMRHRQNGNVDFKLGLTIAASSMAGVEIGSRCLQWVLTKGLAEETVLAVSIIIMLTLGVYTVWESLTSLNKTGKRQRKDGQPDSIHDTVSGFSFLHTLKWKPLVHFRKSGITISLWVILGIGLCTGILSGLLGVGGGFIMVPALIYLVGLPSFLAVGTDLFQIIFSSAYGALRNTMNGNVLIFAAFIMILSSATGVQCGVLGSRWLKGITVKLVLSFAILVAILGSGLKLINTVMNNSISWLPAAEKIVTFGGLGLVLIAIGLLFYWGIRMYHGKKVPEWFLAFGNHGSS